MPPVPGLVYASLTAAGRGTAHTGAGRSRVQVVAHKLHGGRPDPQDYRIARKALELMADPIGRSPRGPGRPLLWRIRNSDEKELTLVKPFPSCYKIVNGR
jgi:hypothetical protein